ncbi:hypothetical protein F383_39397 [Gossypium arboreum]|uniref:Uncharacterized protein n=1 Tax=Gossypium arboreum TaxID=29729 RepID=A0A0B0MQI7_GOSAR|nr:hypothetical protein F383_39397 [Gossypium arboreum]
MMIWHYILTRMNFVLKIVILCVSLCVYVFLCIKFKFINFYI